MAKAINSLMGKDHEEGDSSFGCGLKCFNEVFLMIDPALVEYNSNPLRLFR